MIRGALRLAIAGAGIAYALDRILGEQSAGREPEPISSMIVIDAPIERVWAELADVAGQPRWMHEIKAIRVPDGPIGVGMTCEADVRMFGITRHRPGHDHRRSNRRTATPSATTARSRAAARSPSNRAPTARRPSSAGTSC